jgi:hypothetical protein
MSNATFADVTSSERTINLVARAKSHVSRRVGSQRCHCMRRADQAPHASSCCARRRLTSPAINYHLASAHHWAAAAHDSLWRFGNAADKRQKQYSCSASPNLQRLQHIVTFSNLSDACICSRATLYHLACMGLATHSMPVSGWRVWKDLATLLSLRDAGKHSIISSDLMVDEINHDKTTVPRSIGSCAMDRRYWLTIPRAPCLPSRSGNACCETL